MVKYFPLEMNVYSSSRAKKLKGGVMWNEPRKHGIKHWVELQQCIETIYSILKDCSERMELERIGCIM